MKTIKFSEKVIVADFSTHKETWRKKVLDIVAGEYVPFVKTSPAELNISNEDNNTILCVIHKDYLEKDLVWEHDEQACIGVTSGLCGIFSLDKYKDNNSFDHVWINGVSWIENPEYAPTTDEDRWHEKVCDLVFSTKNGWGSYEHGVATYAGYGYDNFALYVSKVDGKIVGVMVDFKVEKECLDEYFYKREQYSA